MATIRDEKTIEKLERSHQVGDKVKVSVGGFESCWSGEPVDIEGVVEYLGPCEYTLVGPMSRGAKRNLGDVAVIGFGENNHVILTPTLHQVLDDAIFPSVGLNLESLDIAVLKSRIHFRAFYDDVAGSIVVIDAPGLGPADLTQHTYKNIPEGLYPLDKK